MLLIQNHCHDVSISIMYIIHLPEYKTPDSILDYQNTKLPIPSPMILPSCPHVLNKRSEVPTCFQSISLTTLILICKCMLSHLSFYPIPYFIIIICNNIKNVRCPKVTYISTSSTINGSPQQYTCHIMIFSIVIVCCCMWYPDSLSTNSPLRGQCVVRGSSLLRQIQQFLHRSHVVINSYRPNNKLP